MPGQGQGQDKDKLCMVQGQKNKPIKRQKRVKHANRYIEKETYGQRDEQTERRPNTQRATEEWMTGSKKCTFKIGRRKYTRNMLFYTIKKLFLFKVSSVSTFQSRR